MATISSPVGAATQGPGFEALVLAPLQLGHGTPLGAAFARLQLRAQGLSRPVRAFARVLRRAAPVPPGACRPKGVAGHGGSGRAPPANSRTLEVRRRALPTRPVRPHDRALHWPLSAASAASLRRDRAVSDGRRNRDLRLPGDSLAQRAVDRSATAAPAGSAADRGRRPVPHLRPARPADDCDCTRQRSAANGRVRGREGGRAGWAERRSRRRGEPDGRRSADPLRPQRP